MTFTRKQYLANECTHSEYYGQFVDERTKNVLLRRVGRDRIVASADEHFNDIELELWDALPALQSHDMSAQGDFLTLAGKVCIYKEAARQIKESAS